LPLSELCGMRISFVWFVYDARFFAEFCILLLSVKDSSAFSVHTSSVCSAVFDTWSHQQFTRFSGIFTCRRNWCSFVFGRRTWRSAVRKRSGWLCAYKMTAVPLWQDTEAPLYSVVNHSSVNDTNDCGTSQNNDTCTKLNKICCGDAVTDCISIKPASFVTGPTSCPAHFQLKVRLYYILSCLLSEWILILLQHRLLNALML